MISELPTRVGFRWSINEILSLQREFELLGWSIDEIAQKHKRTPNAIMFKLDKEGFADYNKLYNNYYNIQIPLEKTSELLFDYNDSDEEYVENTNDNCDDSEYDEEELSERVCDLEESVSEIKDMIRRMLKTFSKTSTKSSSWF